MVTIFVCVSCRPQAEASAEELARPGIELADMLQARLAEQARSDVVVRRVDCLAVCERPCTVALAGQDKWTYLIGDIDPRLHADEILTSALKVAGSANGTVPLRERPTSFRRGVIARVPPLSFEGEKS
jgi:predicted metal-binding protein